MSRRPPSSPPSIPGFDSIRLLGSGGFADVFLYQQQHPRRQVAVKVLLKERMATSTVASFTEEANLMAQLATHPSIVAVYQAGVSGDGRPYLVMEFCSKPNLQARHRRERFSEAETLRVGIQIAGAVETAHRAGILHRDIKPANILVTEYGRPSLTDFGISTVGGAGESLGMSIPWSPPEVLADPAQSSPASDVYSLAATLYTLLTNRSPFEITGASNGEIDVISRIQSMPLPSIGRADVSSSLEAVLARAMSKSPVARPQSAIEFARALQKVQIELGMQATPIDVIEEDFAAAEEDDEAEETRFSGVRRIDAQPTTPAASAAPAARPVPDDTIQRTPAPAYGVVGSETTVPAAHPHRAPAALPIPAAPALDETVRRAVSESVAEADAPPPRSRKGVLIGVVAGTVLALAVAGIGVAMALGGGGAPTAERTPSSAPVDLGEGMPAAVSDLVGEVSGDGVTFTWHNPDPQGGDSYRWRQVKTGAAFAFAVVDDTTITLPADTSGITCIEVLLVRANGAASETGVEGCAP